MPGKRITAVTEYQFQGDACEDGETLGSKVATTDEAGRICKVYLTMEDMKVKEYDTKRSDGAWCKM